MLTAVTEEPVRPGAELAGTTRIPVTRTSLREGKIPAVVGVIDAATLARSYVIPRRETRNKVG